MDQNCANTTNMTGEELAKARRKLGLSQEGLGKELGMSRVMIGFMERGYDGKNNPVGIELRTELAVWCLLYESGYFPIGGRTTSEPMTCEVKASGRSSYRGHPIIWVNDMWVYEDNKQPIPGWGGESRPCVRCGGEKLPGDGQVDECIGMLPGVDNACCGHGDRSKSYIKFTNGKVVKGFEIEDR